MIKDRGKEIADLLSAPRYKAELEVDGTNKYIMGGVWTLVIPSFPSWAVYWKAIKDD